MKNTDFIKDIGGNVILSNEGRIYKGFNKVNHNSILVRYGQKKGEMEIIK